MKFWDWFVFVFFQMVTVSVIIVGHKLKSNARKSPASDGDSRASLLEDLVMSRQLTLPLFTASLVATWYGGIFGVTALSYEKGIYNFLTQGVFWYITYLLFAFWLAPKVTSSGALTLSDLIHKTFGPKSARWSAVLNIFNVIPVAYTISLAALLQNFTDLSSLNSMIIGVGFVCIYSSWGGFRSVVFSDLIQFALMILAVVAVVVFSYLEFGFFDYLKNSLSSDHMSLTAGENISTLLVWGFIALSSLVDPNFYQRCFAAKSVDIARKGIYISTAIWFIFDICTTLGGLYAYAWSQDLAPNQAYLAYSLHILPTGLKGLFLSGILATILSTLDSYLFLASVTFIHDFLKVKNYKRWHHIVGVFGFAAMSIILALYFQGSIAKVWKTLGSLSSASLLLPVLSAYILPRKLSDFQFVLCSVLSAIAIIVFDIFEKTNQLPQLLESVDSFYIGITTCLITTAFCYFSKKANSL